MPVEQPVLSAILIIGSQRERARSMLRTVLQQSIIDQMEVLLLDCGASDAAPIEGSEHRSVRLIRLNPSPGLGRIRAEGIRLARAPIVVFLEEHARAMPGWAEAIVRAHDGPWAAVGPEIINGNPPPHNNDALALMYYPLWSPPAKHGPSESIPRHNTSYRRDILLRYGEALDSLMFPEDVLQIKLKQDGCEFFLESEMKVTHFFEPHLGVTCQINYYSHRAIESAYDAVLKRPVWKRLLRLVVLPVSPIRRIVRLFLVVLKERPERLDLFFRGLPVYLIVNTAAAMGGTMGILFGMKDTAARFFDIQINAPRVVPAE